MVGRAGTDDVADSFRAGELIDDDQLVELRRWRLADFTDEARDDYVSQAPLIVVCGCGRSGTTLTRVILDSHPDLYAGPESLLLLPLPVDPAALAWKFNLPEADVRELVAGTAGRAQLVESFQAMILRRSGKRVWVDKTARNVHRLDYILRHFPNARIVHVVRDPRDTVGSLKGHRKRKVVAGRVVPTGYCMPVELCIDRWERAWRDAAPFRRHAAFHELSYEALVEDTETTVRHLCAFLDVPFDPGMLNFHEHAAATRDHAKFPQNIEATRPISRSSIGRYRMALTATEIAMTERRLGSSMAELGYAMPPEAPRSVSIAPSEDAAPVPRVISGAMVHEAINGDPLLVKGWVIEALRAHHDGEFLQPPKAYLVTTPNLYDRIIALPAAISTAEPAIGLKWIGSHSGNYARGLQRAHAVIVLNDPRTHAVRVVMDGTLLSTLRTFAMSLIAMDQFAPRPRRVAILGMGRLGRLHAQLLGDLYPSIDQIRCFSRRAPYDDLLSDRRVHRCAEPHDALHDAEVVITASAATSPYIAEDDVDPACRLIVNLSLMDCHAVVIAGSRTIVVDDWLQNTRAERVFKACVDQGMIDRGRVVEIGQVLFGPRRNYDGRVFVNPLGMGMEDVYVAARVARLLGALD